MAKLAIKGHPTRGKEVIEIFEMLGGSNVFRHIGNNPPAVYYIDEKYKKFIFCADAKAVRDCIIFTLEEFLEKYPYKVGDKVNYVKYNDEYPSVYTIQEIQWTGVTIEYLFDSNGFGALTKDLQPYKEETMETITIDDFKANTKEWLIDKLESMSKDNALQAICNIHDELQKSKYTKTYKECCDVLGLNTKEETMQEKKINQMSLANCDLDEVEIFLGDKFELSIKEGKYYAVRKQPKYPQTCEECLNVLSKTMRSLDNMNGYKFGALMHFQQLLICRDAYWKIAGDWKPDYTNPDIDLYVIIKVHNNIEKAKYGYGFQNCVLSFPTEEMRDAFYENFKDLIEECKEFL